MRKSVMVENNGDMVVFHTYLEPTIARSGVVSHSRINFLHVNSTWTFVRWINGARCEVVRPIMPLEGQSRAGVGGTDALYSNIAIDTCAYSLAPQPRDLGS